MKRISFFIKKIIPFVRARYAPRGARLSFAGSGEDLIIDDLLKKYKISTPTYIDIGAYHPVFGNNTYYFYRKGLFGVMVEPNTHQYELIKKKRPRDICINAGVGTTVSESDFYLFDRDTRNTFSAKEALAWEKSSGNKPEIKKMKIINLERIIKEYLNGQTPDLVSIDTEGYEMEVLRGLNWKIKPRVFCIEVISSSNEENVEVFKFMNDKGYKVVGRTMFNAIFCLN